jgi:acyl-CoA thioester hydrolase
VSAPGDGAGELVTFDVPIQLRWADMDVNRHVNNVAVLRLLEEGRVRLFEGRREIFRDGVAVLVAHQEIDYLMPLRYSAAPATAKMWIARLGGGSFTVACRLHDGAGALAAKAETTLVTVDGAGRPTSIPSGMRAALSALSGPPVDFRRRTHGE